MLIVRVSLQKKRGNLLSKQPVATNTEQSSTTEDSLEPESQSADLETTLDDEELEEEIEDELIIEDFTIDGICGVY